MRGIVSALALQSSTDQNTGTSILAAGTWTRWIGLYDASGLGGTVATWDISSAADVEAGVWGQGISDVGWSGCGRYLWVAERKSKGVLVYDVRVTGKLVTWLGGREADTNQRMGVGCFEGEEGTEIWAGGTDGVVRVWEGVGRKEGACDRDWEWKAHDGQIPFFGLLWSAMNEKLYANLRTIDPVGSIVLHPSGTVVATCSGQRAEFNLADDSTSDDSDNESSDEQHASSSPQSHARKAKATGRTPDNSLKVWSLT